MKMKVFFLLTVGLLINLSNCFCQSGFPYDWQGVYQGELQIFNQAALTQKVLMQLEIQKINEKSFAWRIQYGPDSLGLRPYELILKNPEKGQYQIDEKNGIILPADYLGNKLVSIFEVQDNLLVSTYELVGDKIHFSIFMSKISQSLKTGDTADDIPPVVGYPIGIYQTAILQKK